MNYTILIIHDWWAQRKNEFKKQLSTFEIFIRSPATKMSLENAFKIKMSHRFLKISRRGPPLLQKMSARTLIVTDTIQIDSWGQYPTQVLARTAHMISSKTPQTFTHITTLPRKRCPLGKLIFLSFGNAYINLFWATHVWNESTTNERESIFRTTSVR